jgi:hypothetical protein
MEKALISLQKISHGDTLMQNRSKEQQEAGETAMAGGKGHGVDPRTYDPYNELSPEIHEREQKAGMTRDRRDWARDKKRKGQLGEQLKGTPKSRLAAKRGESDPGIENLPW